MPSEDGVFRPQGPKWAATSEAGSRAEPGERCSCPSTCGSVCSEMKWEGGPGQTRTAVCSGSGPHQAGDSRGLGVQPPTRVQEEEGGTWVGGGGQHGTPSTGDPVVTTGLR